MTSATPEKVKNTSSASNYTYILKCADGTYYTGWTTDLARRIKAHNHGTGAKYTRTRRPVCLVYAELHKTKSDAMKREAAIKKLSRKEKEALAASYSGAPSLFCRPVQPDANQCENSRYSQQH